MSMRIKKGDTVFVISGKDRGKTGKVIAVDPRAGRITVDGLNLFKKHVRPRRQGEKGQVVSVPRPLASAKVMPVCSSCGKPARVRHRREGTRPVRACARCGAIWR